MSFPVEDLQKSVAAVQEAISGTRIPGSLLDALLDELSTRLSGTFVNDPLRITGGEE